MRALLLAGALAVILAAMGQQWEAKVESVYDGDTLTATIELGLETSRRETVRLAGIDAPEMGTIRGPVSRDRLRALVAGKQVVIESRGREKYGRLMAVVWLGTTNVNELLVKEGLAVPYNGGKRVPQ